MSDLRPTQEVLKDIAALFDELAEHFEQAQAPRTPKTVAVAQQKTDPGVADFQKMLDGKKKPGGRTIELTDEVYQQSLPQAIAIARRIIAGIGANNPNLKSGLTGQLALQHIQYDAKLIDEAIRTAKTSAPEDDEPI